MRGLTVFIDATAPARQAAIQHLAQALKPFYPEITSLYYNSEKDEVEVQFKKMLLCVNIAGDSCIAMIADVIRQIEKHI